MVTVWPAKPAVPATHQPEAKLRRDRAMLFNASDAKPSECDGGKVDPRDRRAAPCEGDRVEAKMALKMVDSARDQSAF